MAQIHQGAEAKEVTDFRFRQMSQYQLQHDEKHLSDYPKSPIQRLAISNRFGKVFAGCHNSLICVDVAVLENKDEVACCVKVGAASPNKMFKPLSAEDGSKLTTAMPSTPTHLGINADDTSLAVALTLPDTLKPHIYIFDTRLFLGQQPSANAVNPFLEIPAATPPGINIVEILWNPVDPLMLAVVFSDGSLARYVIDQEGKVDSTTLPSAEKICCVSWSPKGKQLVAGKIDGSLTQYKPDLKEAKKIPPPIIQSEPGRSFIASSVLWISTYQFLVSYKDSSSANLYIVQSSKAGDTKYFNYDDPCYSTSDNRDPYFMMYQQMDWSIIFCASANSLEVALMGMVEGQASWQQWILEDAGRAELPLVSSTSEERYPVGMAFAWGGVSRCLPIDEAGNSMPYPMPILFLLTGDGILCGFYTVNKLPGAAQVTKASETPTGQARYGNIILPTHPIPQGVPSQTKQLVSNPSIGTAKVNLTSKWESLPQKRYEIAPITSVSDASLGVKLPGTKHVQTPGQPVVASTPIKIGSVSETPLSRSDGSFSKPTTDGTVPFSFSKQSTTFPTPLTSTFAESSKSVTSSKGTIPTDLTGNEHSTISFETEERYQAAIREEILSFEKELSALRNISANLNIHVGSQDEKVELKKGLAGMEGFSKALVETTASQSREISQLKKASLENFEWAEEAKSRHIRNKDPRHQQLLRGRALDPHSQKQLAKVQSKFMYLDQQLNEINTTLDLEWEAHCKKTKQQVSGRGTLNHKQTSGVPSMETVYRVLHNHHSIIEEQKALGDKLVKEVKELKMNNINSNWQAPMSSPFRSRATVEDDELVRLAESLIEKTSLGSDLPLGTIVKKHKSPPQNNSALSPIKGFSPVKESKLRQFLAEKGTTKIRSRIPGKPSPMQVKLDTFISPEKSVSNSEKNQGLCASRNLISSLDKYEEKPSSLPTSSDSAISNQVGQINFQSMANEGLKINFKPVTTQSATVKTIQTSPNASSASSENPMSASNSSVVGKATTVNRTSSSLLDRGLFISSNTASTTLFGAKTQTATPFKLGTDSTTVPQFGALSTTTSTKSDQSCYGNVTDKSTTNASISLASQSSVKFKSDGLPHGNLNPTFSLSPLGVPAQTSLPTTAAAKAVSFTSTTNLSLPVTTTADLTKLIPSTTNAPSAAITKTGFTAAIATTATSTPFSFLGSNHKSPTSTSTNIFGSTKSSPTTEISSKSTTETVSSKPISAFGLSTESNKLTGFNFGSGSGIMLTATNAPTNTTISTTGVKFSTAESTTLSLPDKVAISSVEKTKSVTFLSNTTTATTPAVVNVTPIESTTSVFGGFSQSSNTSITSSSLFGTTASTKTTSAFEGLGTQAIASTKADSIFSTPTTTSSFFASKEKDQPSLFGSGGNTSSSIFGGTSHSISSAVDKGSAINSGQSTNTSSLFGGGITNTTTSKSIFGGEAIKQSATPVSHSSSTVPSTGTTASIFGGGAFQTPASSGTAAVSSTSSSIFGGNTDTKPDASANVGSIFGGSGSGGFFSGLGSTPSSDSASKNVFGGGTSSGGIFEGSSTSSSLFSTPNAVTSTNPQSIFGSSTNASPFGGAKTEGFGSFSTGNSTVASQGFGVNQPQSPVVQTGAPAFGAAPTFGGSPASATTIPTAFGGAPSFGMSPSFTGKPTFGASSPGTVFGGTSSSNVPTFGTLGAVSNAPTFGAIGVQPSGENTFGGLGSSTTAFGSASGQPSTFGGFGSATPSNSGSLFGSSGGTGATSPGGASFSSWR